MAPPRAPSEPNSQKITISIEEEVINEPEPEKRHSKTSECRRACLECPRRGKKDRINNHVLQGAPVTPTHSRSIGYVITMPQSSYIKACLRRRDVERRGQHPFGDSRHHVKPYFIKQPRARPQTSRSRAPRTILHPGIHRHDARSRNFDQQQELP